MLRSLALSALVLLAACAPDTPRTDVAATPPGEASPPAAAPALRPPPAAPVVLPANLRAAIDGKPVTVYKTATCGCCAAWVDHLRMAGFAVEVQDVADVAAVRDTLGLPQGLESCHTARVGGYVVEGHVPAADIARLLAERPEGVAGIAVPGMPMGSPGMEVPGRPADPYDVLAFGSAGQSVFASHR